MTEFRMKLASVLLATAFVLNVIIIARGQESPGWPLAAMFLLAAAGLTLLAQRRPWG